MKQPAPGGAAESGLKVVSKIWQDQVSTTSPVLITARNERTRNADQAQRARGLVPCGSKMPDAPQKAQRRLKPKTYAAVPAQAMNDDRLKPCEWRVLACVSWHADPDGYAWPSQELIARETRLHRVTVNKATQQLRTLGYLVIMPRKRRHGHWRANGYRVVRLKPQIPADPP